jgi:hypothetical protein
LTIAVAIDSKDHLFAIRDRQASAYSKATEHGMQFLDGDETVLVFIKDVESLSKVIIVGAGVAVL